MKTVDAIAWYFSLAFLTVCAAYAAYVFCLDSSAIAKATAGLILITGITNAMTARINYKQN